MRHFLRVFIFIMAISSITTSYANSFTIMTHAFSNNGTMPSLYTCSGSDVSPQLSWDHFPIKTQSFALIVSDPDAPNGTFYHWIVYNIPKTTTVFAKGIANYPSDTLIGTNSFDKQAYKGPCPPKGDPKHHYVFTLYALDKMLKMTNGVKANEILPIIKNHVLSKTQLTGVFSRPKK